MGQLILSWSYRYFPGILSSLLTAIIWFLDSQGSHAEYWVIIYHNGPEQGIINVTPSCGLGIHGPPFTNHPLEVCNPCYTLTPVIEDQTPHRLLFWSFKQLRTQPVSTSWSGYSTKCRKSFGPRKAIALAAMHRIRTHRAYRTTSNLATPLYPACPISLPRRPIFREIF